PARDESKVAQVGLENRSTCKEWHAVRRVGRPLARDSSCVHESGQAAVADVGQPVLAARELLQADLRLKCTGHVRPTIEASAVTTHPGAGDGLDLHAP